MSDPWMKFYPRDWRGDQSLRAVSLAARGLWMECLCIMHEAKPYGHLLLNGEPVGDDALARMTGVSVDEVSVLMAELRKAGTFSVTRDGVIFSRRMTKDHARAGKGRKAAKKRWAQSLENTVLNGAPNGSPNGNPTTQKPEARSQKKERDKSLSSAREPKADRVTDTVEAIWPKLPKRKRGLTSKAKLAKPVGKILKAGTDPQRLIAAVTACYTLPRHTEDDGQFAPAVYSWLSDGVWENWCTADGGGEAPDGEAPPLTDDHWRSIFRTWCETGQWPTALAGPSPEAPDCRAPAEMIKTAMEWKAGRAA